MMLMIRVEAEHIKHTIFGDRFRFIARSYTGNIVAASTPFESATKEAAKTRQPDRGAAEVAALETFVNDLIKDGWRVVSQSSIPWFALEMAQGSEEEISAYQRESFLRGPQVPAVTERRSGISVQTMWAVSLIVIVVLFGLCVLLVFTSEIRFTAQ